MPAPMAPRIKNSRRSRGWRRYRGKRASYLEQERGTRDDHNPHVRAWTRTPSCGLRKHRRKLLKEQGRMKKHRPATKRARDFFDDRW